MRKYTNQDKLHSFLTDKKPFSNLVVSSCKQLPQFSLQKTKSPAPWWHKQLPFQDSFPSPPPLPFPVQFEVNYRKVNGAERMPVGWVMMSKHLALPGQQLGSGDANEGTGLHLVPQNELMQLSVSALMNMEITRERPEKQDTDGGWGLCPQQGDMVMGTMFWLSMGAASTVLTFSQGFTQTCFPWVNTPALHTRDQIVLIC